MNLCKYSGPTSLWLCFVFLFCGIGYALPLVTEKDLQENLHWGTETNCLKAGVVIRYAPVTNLSFPELTPALYYSCESSSNPDWPNHLRLWMPPFNSRYQLELVDQKGHAVPKTEEGKALGRTIDQPLMLSDGINYKAGYRRCILTLKTIDTLEADPIPLEKYFVITNTGKYNLEFKMVIIWPREKNPTNIIHLPPVNVVIDIETTN